MSRKIILFFLFCLGMQLCMLNKTNAQVRDSIAINMPPYTDTSCIGSQLTFYAIPTSDTFTGATYHWYTNGFYTGVVTDTFYTTALATGDVVWCVVYFTNSFGLPDSFRSNSITVYRVAVMNPNVLIYLTAGNNPACSAQPLTFRAYPINGGTNPLFQWFVNGVPLTGEDSSTINMYFVTGDTVSCQIVSNSPCAPFDTVMSAGVAIIQEHYYATLTINELEDSICNGAADTFVANLGIPVNGANYQWFVNGDTAVGAIASTYITDTLKNGDSVFCIMYTGDTCVLNQYVFSNGLKVIVKHVYGNFANYGIIAGINPGCLDSPVTFGIQYDSFGTAPAITWSINGVPYTNAASFTDTFMNGDTVSVEIYGTDGGCYSYDTIRLAATIMERDSTPVSPLVSLIGDILVANSSGTFSWYGPMGLIPGANAQTYHPTVRGCYYAVKIGNGINEYNCPSLPSNTICITLTGVTNVYTGNISFYPNPSTGLVEMDWNGQVVNMKLDVYDMFGQVLLHETIDNQSHHETDMSAFSSGAYLLVFHDADGNAFTYRISILK